MTGNAAARAPMVTDLDTVIVGAGFSGMYALHLMRQRGMSAVVFEAGDSVGGTWYWNRYPGARCDVESINYQYGFSDELQRNWNWTERYPTQPEIMRYMEYVAGELDLKRDIRFETRVKSATYNETTRRWTVTTDRGDVVTCQYCIMATGCLSAAQVPNFEGLDSFAGKWYHTGQWPHEGVDFTGKRVAVIGTGSSGVQAIPVIAEQAADLTVFQRTPNYSLPAFNRPLKPGEHEAAKESFMAERAKAKYTPAGINYPYNPKSGLEVSRDELYAELEERWFEGGFAFLGAYNDIVVSPEVNAVVADFVRNKIAGVVKDPETAALLTPTDHPFGTKRLCLDTNYFDTFNQPHVHLVSVRDNPIERITPKGIIAGGKEYEFDAIVFATGFDAMTGALSKIDITGRGGRTLRDKWSAGPKVYLGLVSSGFPNLFTVTGPGSPSVLTSVIVAIEQHVEWIMDCIDFMKERGFETIDSEKGAEEGWVAHVNEVANMTLMMQANSWYLGANVPGKPRIFMPYVGGLDVYRRKCEEIAANGYEGFTFEKARELVS
jgi:cyclohexanone monooxygenase